MLHGAAERARQRFVEEQDWNLQRHGGRDAAMPLAHRSVEACLGSRRRQYVHQVGPAECCLRPTFPLRMS